MSYFLFDELDFDFQYHLRKAIEFQNWKNNEKEHAIKEYSDFNYEKDCYVPIGSVEFVDGYLNKHFNLQPEPIQIPASLMEERYTKRECGRTNGFQLMNDFHGYFYKGLNRYKDPDGGIYNGEELDGEKMFFFSEIIEIESEWRGFVFKGELVGLQNYLGDFTKFPNVSLIKEMINNFEEQPKAYTIDVGINDSNETFIIEIHDFYSVGFYGFQDYNKIPVMFSQWYYQFLSKNYGK